MTVRAKDTIQRDLMNDFSARLRAAAERKRWKQVDLRRASGVSQSRINAYWNEGMRPSGANLFALAEALEVDPRWLLCGTRAETESRENTTARSLEENQLLWCFRQLGDGERFAILSIIEKLAGGAK